MKNLQFAVAAIFAACLGVSAIAVAADSVSKDAKATATKNYWKATKQAKANYKKAAAECRKLAADKQSACLKEARVVRRTATDEAGDAYSRITSQLDPSLMSGGGD